MLEVFLDGIRASDDFKCVIKMQQYSVPTGSRIVPEYEGYQEKQKVLASWYRTTSWRLGESEIMTKEENLGGLAIANLQPCPQ